MIYFTPNILRRFVEDVQVRTQREAISRGLGGGGGRKAKELKVFTGAAPNPWYLQCALGRLRVLRRGWFLLAFLFGVGPEGESRGVDDRGHGEGRDPLLDGDAAIHEHLRNRTREQMKLLVRAVVNCSFWLSETGGRPVGRVSTAGMRQCG